MFFVTLHFVIADDEIHQGEVDISYSAGLIKDPVDVVIVVGMHGCDLGAAFKLQRID